MWLCSRQFMHKPGKGAKHASPGFFLRRDPVLAEHILVEGIVGTFPDPFQGEYATLKLCRQFPEYHRGALIHFQLTGGDIAPTSGIGIVGMRKCSLSACQALGKHSQHKKSMVSDLLVLNLLLAAGCFTHPLAHINQVFQAVAVLILEFIQMIHVDEVHQQFG